MSDGQPRIAPHEAAGSSQSAPLPPNRHFGLVVGGVAIAVGLLILFSRGAGPVASVLVAAGWVLVILALIAPKLLSWPNQLWMKFGALLGLVMTPIFMGVIYVTTFLPIGLIMRFMGRDPLSRSRKPAGESYWIVRTPPGPDPATMTNQF